MLSTALSYLNMARSAISGPALPYLNTQHSGISCPALPHLNTEHTAINGHVLATCKDFFPQNAELLNTVNFTLVENTVSFV
jgi:hypothetical protein